MISFSISLENKWEWLRHSTKCLHLPVDWSWQVLLSLLDYIGIEWIKMRLYLLDDAKHTNGKEEEDVPLNVFNWLLNLWTLWTFIGVWRICLHYRVAWDCQTLSLYFPWWNFSPGQCRILEMFGQLLGECELSWGSERVKLRSWRWTCKSQCR